MNLVTRCPACGTSFKVVQDQLRISEGWVRCGRCSEVFDAAQDLQDGETGARVAWESLTPVPAADGTSPDETAGAHAERPDPAADRPGASPSMDRPSPWVPDWPAAEALNLAPGVVVAPPASTSAPAPDAEVAPASPELPAGPVPLGAVLRVADEPVLDNDAEAEKPAAPEADAPATNGNAATPEAAMLREADAALAAAHAPAASATDTAAPAAPPAGPAGFESLATRAEAARQRVRRARRYGLLLALVLLAAALLGVQVVRHQRESRAASLRIDAVRIDGSSFTPARTPGQFQLSFTLRNAAAVPVQMPAIDLLLLDMDAQPVLRRVVQPQEFGAPAQMPAHGEQAASLVLALQPPPGQGPPAVAGYSLFAFYP